MEDPIGLYSALFREQVTAEACGVELGSLKKMLNPKTVALLGASDKENSLGQIIMRNLTSSGDHRTFPVNPRADVVQGVPCFSTITDIPDHIDLAVVATPAPIVPQLVYECGKKGVEGIIIISRSFTEGGGEELEKHVISWRRQFGVRIMGPNCLGIIRPGIGLNACLLPFMPEGGKIAFLSESGALGSAMLDWAVSRRIGFSMFASLGSMSDIDFGDLVDFVGDDDQTRSILLFMKRVGEARKFVSAVRGFARSKPIIVMKPGRFSEVEKSLVSGALLRGDDRVYDSVFERTGMVRIEEVADLFGAATVLDSKVLPRGPKLAIISNSPSAGGIAAAILTRRGGFLSGLSDGTVRLLDSGLPLFVKNENPVIIPDDSGIGLYETTMKACMDDPGVDAVLLVYTHLGSYNPLDVSKKVVASAKNFLKPLITVWLGGKSVDAARDFCVRNDVPGYATPEEAIKTYLYMYRYRRNLDLQYETPEELGVDMAPPKNHLRALVRRNVDEGRTVLSEEESRDFLITYGIPVLPVSVSDDVSGAVFRAERIGYPVRLRIDSPDIKDKKAAGGVVTNIRSPGELRSGYLHIVDNSKRLSPGARILGVSIQKMIEPIDHELLLAVRTDEDFGPVIIFGLGGTAGQIIEDWSIGIPPLNQTLARRLMEKTKAFEMLCGSKGGSSVSLADLDQIIVSISNLIVDFPEIASIDIQELVISKGQPLALDARITLWEGRHERRRDHLHLVISPYPTHYITIWKMRDGTEATLRPIRPEDEPLLQDMLDRLSEQSMRSRFFSALRHISHEMMVRLCNLDYDRHMAVVAEVTEDSKPRIIGTARLIAEADMRTAEFAVVVSDDYQGKGLGYKLIDAVIGIGQDWGLDEIYGEVLTDNERMLALTRRLGFARQWLGGGVTKVVLKLK